MADAMAPDDILRACGYLEAVWMDDTANQTVLLDHGPGETPTPVLVTELGELIMQIMFPAQFGIHDGLTSQELEAAAEKMNADPTVRVSRVLIETLKDLAPTATAAQAEMIGRALISYIVAISSATEDDVLPLLNTLRQTTLQRPVQPGA
jgi:hypothetical protein